jgi:hypothetical protein
MIAKCEAQQAWLENVTYQMCNMVSTFQIEKTGGKCLSTVIQGTIKELGWTNRFPQDAINTIRRRYR